MVLNSIFLILKGGLRVLLFFILFYSISLKAETLFFLKNNKKVFFKTISKKIVVKNKVFNAIKVGDKILYPSGKIFVKFKKNNISFKFFKIFSLIDVVKKIKRTDFFVIMPKERENFLKLMKNLYNSDEFETIIPVFFHKIAFKSMTLPPNDTFFPEQWTFENRGQSGGIIGEDAKILEAWRFIVKKGLTPGKGVEIGIIDDGFDLCHEDLNQKFLEGYNVAKDNNLPNNGLHGTSVAGIVGAVTNNKKGVAGVCPFCQMVPVKIGNDFIDGESDVNAFNYLLDKGVPIISNSWGPADNAGAYFLSEPMKELFKFAGTKARDGKGVSIVFAAGNGNESISDLKSFDGYASNPYTIAVGAVNSLGIKTLYSDYGSTLDFVAPSCDTDVDALYDPFNLFNIKDGVFSTDNTGLSGYNSTNYTPDFGGTSAAAPLVSGVIGLILSVSPELSAKQIYSILKSTADKVDYEAGEYSPFTGFSEYYGYGRINALKAVKKACEIGSCKGSDKKEGKPFYKNCSNAKIDNKIKNPIMKNENLIPKTESGCSCLIVF